MDSGGTEGTKGGNLVFGRGSWEAGMLFEGDCLGISTVLSGVIDCESS